MIKQFKIVVFIIVMFSSNSGLATENLKKHGGPTSNPENEAKDLAYDSFRKILVNSIIKNMERDYKGAIADPGELILLLGEMKTEESKKILLELIEVYIGSATGEDLGHVITKQGKNIEANLKAMLKSPILCILKKFEEGISNKISLECSEKQERDNRIKYYLNLIKKGEIIEVTP